MDNSAEKPTPDPRDTHERTAQHLAQALPGGEFHRVDPKGVLSTSLRYIMADMHNSARSSLSRREPLEIARLARIDPSLVGNEDNFRFLDEYANNVTQRHSNKPKHRQEAVHASRSSDDEDDTRELPSAL